MGRYQSGQMGQTVNLLAYAYGGSNPSLPTQTADIAQNQVPSGVRVRASLQVQRNSAPLENPTRTEEFHRANGCCHGWMVWVHKVR